MSDDELLTTIHAELEADRVYIDPAVSDEFTPAQVTALEQAAAEHDAFVIAYPFARHDQFGGEAEDLIARLHDTWPVDGLYLSNWPRSSDGTWWYLTNVGYGAEAELDDYFVDFTIGSVVVDEQPATLGAAYTRTFELMDLPEDEVRQLERETYDDGDDPPSDFAEGVSEVPSWVWIALVVPVLSAVAWRWLVHRRTLRPVNQLPPSAVNRIRQAHDVRLLARAREELLQLGEAIDAADLRAGGDTAAWQAALDHYDAGQRLVDAAEPEVLEVIGAIVLADRGRTALAAALAGRAWVPARPCFLNPLHGHATGSRKVTWQGTTVDAPLCATCRDALAQQRTPDMLDVAHRGEPVHYFETDREPWASSGYGALHADLLERLHARG